MSLSGLLNAGLKLYELRADSLHFIKSDIIDDLYGNFCPSVRKSGTQKILS